MAEENDDADLSELLNDGWGPPPNLSDEVKARILTLEAESRVLSALISDLGARLSAGEIEVRKDLNPAINRQNQVSSELFNIRKEAGFRPPPQIMYGPPWRMG